MNNGVYILVHFDTEDASAAAFNYREDLLKAAKEDYHLTSDQVDEFDSTETLDLPDDSRIQIVWSTLV